MGRKAERRRRRMRIRGRSEIGAPPGLLEPQPETPPPFVTLMAYGPQELIEQKIRSPDEVRPLIGLYPVVWVNVEGLGHPAILRSLAQTFGVHRLAMEDVVNVVQRVKLEDYGDHLFMVVRMMRQGEHLETQQLSLFLAEKFLLTFEEHGADQFEAIRQRIRRKVERIRAGGPDYLAYAILDSIVDHYFPTLETFEERLEAIDEEVATAPQTQTGTRIHELKRELRLFRRMVAPMRTALEGLLLEPEPLITNTTRLYLRDCADHIIRQLEHTDFLGENTSDLMHFHQAVLSNRMNEIMKVLTVMAAIFIPLTFIAGVYGMNFNPESSPFNMPELGWYWGYPSSLGVMALVALALIFYFRRKGWY